MEWKQVAEQIGKFAPALGGVLGGPGGAALGGLVAAALGVGNNPGEVAAAITGNPDAIVKLRELESTERVRLTEIASEQAKALAAIEAADRASARQMQTETRSRMPAVLAIAVTIGFFGVLARLLASGLPESGGEVLLILIGALATAWTSVLAFYFGTTSNSQIKTELIARKG